MRDGRLLIDDEHNNAIRALGRDGSLCRFMGGQPGRAPEGTEAARAR